MTKTLETKVQQGKIILMDSFKIIYTKTYIAYIDFVWLNHTFNISENHFNVRNNESLKL